MKRNGILNTELSARLASLGHTDAFLVTDSGFPVPPGVPVVDLRLVYGTPRFDEVLSAILADVVVETAVIASEAESANPSVVDCVRVAVPSPEFVLHVDLKGRASDARFAVRTGEATPYANVLLTAGVGFEV